MSKITELTELKAAGFSESDLLLIRDISASDDKKMAVMSLLGGAFTHNIPRLVPKDITAYVTDGSLWDRLNGTNGYAYLEDIFVGDYFKMSRAITCPDSYNGNTGTQWVTIAGINTLSGNGDTISMQYNHLVMVPGKGFDLLEKNHFGRHRMNPEYDSSAHTGGSVGGYYKSEMHQSVLGAVVSAGSTASGATINQQLYAEFGSHLKTTRELLSNNINEGGYNRFGSASGCANGWGWYDCQAVLMSEVEVYGGTIWSSSGYDTGSAYKQLPVFADKRAANNRKSYYFLKDVASASSFCRVLVSGLAGYGGANDSGSYVRPRFVLAA